MERMYISALRFEQEEKVVNKVEPKYQQPFVVRFTPPRGTREFSDGYKCSATYNEIMEAFNTGAVIIGELYDYEGKLIGKTRNVNMTCFDGAITL